jgi:hypothetical protein
MIEPTEETGYRYLEIVQETRKSLSEFTFTADDLRLPLILFQLRKTHAGDAEIQTQLNDVFKAIVAKDLDTARTILDEFKFATPTSRAAPRRQEARHHLMARPHP